MPKALLLTAHPNTDSFNHALSRQLAHTLEQADWQLLHSNLYQMAFRCQIIGCGLL